MKQIMKIIKLNYHKWPEDQKLALIPNIKGKKP